MLPSIQPNARNSQPPSRHLRFELTESISPKPLFSPRSTQSILISPRSVQKPALEDGSQKVIDSFERSLRTYEERVQNLVAGEEPLSVYRPMVAGSSYVNPEITKNIQRVNIMRHTVAPKTDSRPGSVSEQKPVTISAATVMDRQYIDKYYPHASTSRATNRLPLPYSPDFNLSRILVHAKLIPPPAKYTEEPPDATFQDTLNRDREFLLSLLPQEEEEKSNTRDKRDTQNSDGVKTFWRKQTTFSALPESREGACICVLDRKLYMFGGQSMVKRNDVRMLNPDTWTWSLLSTQYTPKGRIGHSLISYKRQLVLFGGWSHYSQRLRLRRCFKKLYILFLDDDVKWQRFRGDGRMPKSRRYHAAAALGSTMIIFGGVDTQSKVLHDVYSLDMEIFHWTKHKLEGGPGPRSNCTLTAVFHPSLLTRYDFSALAMPKLRMDQIMPNSGFFMFGGLDSKAQPCNDLWMLGVFESGFIWQKLDTQGTPPIPRSDHTAVMVSGYLAILGGRNDHKAQDIGCLGDLWMLRIENLQWEQVTTGGSPPPPRWSHCAVVVGTKMLVLGGIDYSHFLPSDLFLMETDQVYASEALRQEEIRSKAMKMQLMKKLSKDFIFHLGIK